MGKDYYVVGETYCDGMVDVQIHYGPLTVQEALLKMQEDSPYWWELVHKRYLRNRLSWNGLNDSVLAPGGVL